LDFPVLSTTRSLSWGASKPGNRANHERLFLFCIRVESMTDIKWIKITTNIFDDEKIKCIEKMPEGDTILIIWIKLLVLAGRCNDCGMVYLTREIPYNEDMITTVIGRQHGIVKLAIDTFIKLGMIEVKDNYIDIVKWEKYQNIDGMEKIREKTRKRVQEHRDRKKQIQCNVTETLPVTHGNAIDIDIDKEIDKDKRYKDISSTFDKFWNLYDKKIALKKCRIAWNKINPELHESIFNHVGKYIVSTPDKSYRKNPLTYLNGEHWNDEIIIKQKPKRQKSFRERDGFYESLTPEELTAITTDDKGLLE